MKEKTLSICQSMICYDKDGNKVYTKKDGHVYLKQYVNGTIVDFDEEGKIKKDREGKPLEPRKEASNSFVRKERCSHQERKPKHFCLHRKPRHIVRSRSCQLKHDSPRHCAHPRLKCCKHH